MRCDLHVHSWHSGPSDLPLLGRLALECYSEPEEVYAAARGRGMDLVTLTDHDSIAGALSLRARPGTFVSEEVTCFLPEGRVIHLGVFDINEAQHESITRLRFDAEALFAFLAEQRIPACVNHLFSALTGPRALSDFSLALSRVSLIEARNGMLPAATNDFAATVGRELKLALVGGSDAHTLASVARAWTHVPEAATREEFLAALRGGFTVPAGRTGTYARLTRDVARIAAEACSDIGTRAFESPRSLALLALVALCAPVGALIPAFTAIAHLRERVFAARHYRRFRAMTLRERSRASGRTGPWTPGARPALVS